MDSHELSDCPPNPMRKTPIAIYLLMVVLPGCWETPSVFEKQYVRIEIPGYTADDYLRLLESDNPDLRYLALGNLIEDKLTEGKTVSERIGVLLEDPSAKVRGIAAFATKSIKPERFETGLIKLLQDDSDAVRLEVVAALGRICANSKQAAQGVLDRIDDANILVRLQAIDTLAGCKSSALRPEIVRRLSDDLPKRTNLEQLMSIGTLGSLGEREEVESRLLVSLGSEDHAMVTVAAEALARQRSSSAVQPLLSALQQERGSAKVLVSALGSIGTPEAIQALSQSLEVSDEQVRIAAIEAIGETKGSEGLAALINRFTIYEAAIQGEADSVKWKDVTESYPELGALLEAISKKRFGDLDETRTFDFSQLIMSQQEYEKIIGLQFLAYGEPYDRVIVPFAAEERKDLFPYLERLASGDSLLLRVFALRAIGNTVDSRSGALLEAAAHVAPFGIRYAAIEALGKYVGNTGDYSSLHRLYDRKEQFIPSDYTDEDQALLIRKLIDTVLADGEREDATRRRRIAELATSSSAPTRLVAALQIGDSTGLPVFFELLESGARIEKRAALKAIEQFLDSSDKTISKLQELKMREQDAEISEGLDQVIARLKGKAK